MTKPKNKVSLLGLVVAFVFMVAGIFMFVPNNIATVSAEDLDNEIHFDVTASEQTIVFAPGAQTVDEVTVTYTVVNTNDGINNLVFIPAYNHDVFAIDEITVNADTNLGDATITNGYSSYTGDYVKLAFDSTTLFDAEDVTLVTITYTTKENLTYLNNGTYNFSLLLNYTDLTQTRSTAYYILGEENLGEQEEVEIIVNSANVELYIQRQGQLELVTTQVVYDANEVGISLNGENEVTYSYTGNDNITWTWYDEENGNVISTPTNAGTYYLTGVMAANNVYSGANTAHTVVVTTKAASVVIDNKTSAYGDAIVALTHQAPTGLLGNDTLVIDLSTTATSSSNVGEYAITGTVGTGSNPNYNVTFTNGTYTITARAITIKANDQSAQYTGSEPTVDQTEYTVTGATITSGVTITKQAGVNVGSYTLTPSYTNTNYSITFENGTFYITSVGKDAEYIFGFFSGDTVTYDTNSHDLLIVSNQKPSWIAYQPSNNIQTNAGDYTIGISVTLSAQDAANYTNGVTEFNSTVTGKINPYAITVTADNKSHVYGNNPAELTPVAVGVNNNNEVNVTFTVYKDYGEETEEAITLSTSTPVGTYTIVPSATNSNYTFTFVEGEYKVTKATPVVTVSASDVYYNRNLVNSYGVVVNELTLTNNDYTVVILDKNNNQVSAAVLDAGEYTLVVTAIGTDNYNEVSKSATFEVKKVDLATPTVTYQNGTATWTVVSNDAGAENVDAKALVNGTTVTYAINNVAVDGTSYTATSKDALTLTVSSSNANYNSVSVNLATLFAVTFNEGTHPATQDNAQNMPETQYIFNGAKAVAPATNPTLTGYTFEEWDFDFDTAITEDTTVVALWEINQVTMTVVYYKEDNNDYVETSKTFDVDYGTEVAISTYNLKLQAGLTGDNDEMVTSYDKAGMNYEFKNLWSYKVTGSDEYIETEIHQVPVNATQNYTFVAVYTATPINYTLTYMLKTDNGEYVQYNEEEIEVAYNTLMSYVTLNPVQWFRTEAWFTDANRTTSAPERMPAGNLTVYGARVFNIGSGDVNGDGEVTTDDITLYRQWIVGGYTMKVVENGNEYATATSEQFNAQNVYYLKRVADINVDLSKDIRDVSITRMSIAGGYKWDIVTGENVTGEEIIRNVYSANIDNIEAALLNGGRATVYADITDLDKEIEIVRPESIYIDLNGHTIYIKSFDVRTTGVNATITVLNGTIKTTDGITIAAPNGNVILQDLEGWVNDNQVNLQAASNSLHIKQNVAFYNYAYEQQENQEEPVLTLAPAIVKVEKDTHIVVEQQADLVVEKIVVTEQNFAQEAQTVDAKISVTVNSAETSIIEVAGNCDVANNVAETKVLASNDPNLDLVKAAKNGGEFTLEKDYLITEPIVVESNLTLNLNGYKIYNEEDIWSNYNWSLISVKSGILTINGNGTLDALANDCYAIDVQNGAELVVNGGTYYGNISAIYAHSGNVTVNGGEFHLKQVMTDSGNAYRFMLNCLDASYKNGISNFVVTGGKFYGFNPEDNASEVAHTDYLQNAYVKATEENNVPVYEVVSNGVTNEQELRDALANQAKTIRVLNDFTVTGEIDIFYNTTIEGNNHTITVNKTDNNKYAFYVADRFTSLFDVYVNNLNIVSTGYQVAMMINTDYECSLNLTNVNITCDGECVYSNGHAVANALNCDFTHSGIYASGKDPVYYSALIVGYGATINATNCNVTSFGNGVATFPSGGYVNLVNTNITVSESASVNENAGYALWARNEDYNNLPGYNTDSIITFESGNVVGEFKITDKFTTGDNNLSEPKIVIIAGIFDNDPTEYLADLSFVEEVENKYVVIKYTGVATEEELLAALENGEEYIALTADIDLSATVYVVEDTTLNLNGHKLYNTTDIWSDYDWSLISVNGANLVINGNGTLDAKANDCYAIDVWNNGTLVINGGTYYGNITAIYAYEGIVTINGGEFHLKQVMTDGSNAYRFMLNCLDVNYKNGSANFYVYGGDFYGFNPQNNASEGSETNYVADGYESVLVDGVYMVAEEGTLIGTGENPSNTPGSGPSIPGFGVSEAIGGGQGAQGDSGLED